MFYSRINIINFFFALACSLIGLVDTSHAFPNPPNSVQASDGNLNTITINWSAPVGGDTPTSYLIYRNATNASCAGSPIALVSASNLTYTDSSFPNTNVFYYSLRAVNAASEQSNCSNTDSGYALGLPPPGSPDPVTASDDLLDRISVIWNLPTNSQPFTSLRLFRTDNQGLKFCNGDLIESSLSPASTSYNDFTATPGVAYFYALKSVGPTGISNCSSLPDSGRRLLPPPPNPPTNVQATDGTFTNKIVVTWVPPVSGGVYTNFKLHRSTNINAGCTSLHVDNISAASTGLDDLISVIPGVQYYYWMQAVGPDGTSDCSLIDPGHAAISPPQAVQASDGTFPDKVLVTWNPPIQGGNITGYDLYRNSNCSGSPIAISLPSTSYNDTSVTPGVIYNYSVKTLSATGSSACSIPDPGHAQISPATNVSATDGAFPDKVNVTWNAPASGQPVTGYILYRDTTPTSCSVLLNDSVATNSYSDFNVVPGTIYYYSVRVKAASGNSVCSNIDPGHSITQCSDSVDNDGDSFIDLNDPGCTGPTDNDESNIFVCSDGKDNDGDGKVDYPEDKGCSSPTDDNEKDPTYICDDGLDNDSDGKIDYRVDGAGDPGCTFPEDSSEQDFDEATLRSPVFTKFNTFIGQWNFAELVNQGTVDKDVKLTVYNLFGQEMISRTVVVPAQSEVDVDVNGLVQYACDVLKQNCSSFEDLSATRGDENGLGRPDGVVDTYGLVKFEFDDSNPEQRLTGRISMYRPNIDGTFSFAFAREFRNPTKGQRTFAMSNTYDPRGENNLVPNWAEVIALGKREPNGNIRKQALNFTLKMYNQEGVLIDTRNFTLPGLGEFDYAAGHEFIDNSGQVIESVYLIEVIPSDPDAEYLMSVARYSSNSPAGYDPSTYNYALVLDGVTGSTQNVYAPVGAATVGVSGANSNISTENWYESACVSAFGCRIQVLFKDNSGNVIASQINNYSAYSQIHFNAGSIVPKGTAGSVEVRVLSGSTIGQSMSYLHGATNDLQAGFASSARKIGKQSQAGSLNTFLNMQNVLSLVATSSASTNASLNAKTFDGGNYSANVGLNSGGASSLGVTGVGILGVPQNKFGALLLSTPNTGQALAEVRRVRLTSKGEIDYIMPTTIK